MQAPTRLGKYEIRREIGRGAMGVVYEAFDPSIGRAVAIKVFHPGSSPSVSAAEMGERFRREARVAGRLSHPNLVVVYEFGDAATGDAASPYIVMELVRGTDLKALLASRGRFTLAEIARIMAELLAALQHAHDGDVVHRDIKPANLMLCHDGRLKVTDFGIAKTADSELTRTGELLGTAAYMSPEQVTGAPIDLRTDIYSAGVILYQLLTGEAPFVGATTTTIIQKILNQEPVPPSVLNVTIPRALDAVVQKAMAKKPSGRYPSAAAFARALASAIDERAGATDDDATIIAPPAGAGRPGRGGRAVVFTAAGAAAVAALGYAGYTWLAPRSAGGATEAIVTPRPASPASLPVARAEPQADEERVDRAATPPSAPAPSASDRTVAPTTPIAPALRSKQPPPAATKPALPASTATPIPAKATPPVAMAPPVTTPPRPTTFDTKPAPGESAATARSAPAAAPPASAAARPASSPATTGHASSVLATSRPASSGAPANRAASSVAAASGPASSVAKAPVAKAGAAPASAPGAGGNALLAACEAKARAGDAGCQTQLGTMYRNGDGVARSAAEAMRWYRLAANQGHAEAQHRLGVMLAGGQGTSADLNEAARWYRKAADQGLAAAQNNLGRCYERGEGVAGSPVLAATWYRKAADQGNASAQSNLGRLYLSGVGVFKDVEQARTLFQKAAGQGNSGAAFLLGQMYEKGNGVPQSNAQAAYWYRVAVAKPDGSLSNSAQERIKSFLAAHP